MPTTRLVGDLDGEHARMLAALEQATAAMRGLDTDASTASAATARSAVTALGAIMLEHLEHEERDLEPFSASQHKTPQFKAAQAAVKKRHLKTFGTFVAWLMDGADADAIVGIRRELPPPVLFAVSRFGGRDYRKRIAPVWV